MDSGMSACNTNSAKRIHLVWCLVTVYGVAFKGQSKIVTMLNKYLLA